MEYTEHKLTLDVHKTVSNASVALKKGDTAHRLLITLSEGGYPYHIGEDCTVAFSALKPDGTAIFNDCRIEGDTVIYDMTEQTTAEEGMVSCEVKIYGANGDLLTSASFLLFVEEGVNNSGAVVSSGEFSTLASMVREVNRATAEAVSATERAKKAANACMVIGSAQGESIRLDDAIDAQFVGMRIFGKTTQGGVPTPANPATLVNMGSVGTIKLTSNDQTIAIPAPGGVPGILVASGGNYIDINGQRWICDEIDLARGVYVKRIHTESVTPEKIFGVDSSYAAQSGTIVYSHLTYGPLYDDTIVIAISDRAKGVSSNERGENGNTYRCYTSGTSAIAVLRYPISAGVKTVEEARADFGGATISYILAVPVETALTDEVLDAYRDYIRSHSGDTVVTNDSGAHMALEYIMDAKKYIDKMISTGIHDATLE